MATLYVLNTSLQRGHEGHKIKQYCYRSHLVMEYVGKTQGDEYLCKLLYHDAHSLSAIVLWYFYNIAHS